jgi:Putative TOS1-like glycosyl hydrolase (DUF2401)
MFCLAAERNLASTQIRNARVTTAVSLDQECPLIVSSLSQLQFNKKHTDFFSDGFGGGTKVFLFEFIMPKEKKPKGNIPSYSYDIPAIWALNAKIARIQQYDKCSCWPGCGELDLFEVLPGLPSAAKTHYHSHQGGEFGGGGNVNYFARPYDKAIKLAAVLINKEVHIVKIPDNVQFDKTLTETLVAGWAKGINVFKVPN